MICGSMAKLAKEIVEIIGENGIKKRKKYPVAEKGDKIIIEKASKGRGNAGWMPEFSKDSFLYYFSGIFPFKRLKRKLMVKDGADKCIDFYGKDGVEVPFYDREASKKFFTANVIKSAGETTQKISIPIFVYHLLFISLMLGIVNILVSSGRIYF